MANDEHVALLKQGVDAWNAWRRENPDIRPDLRGASLVGADLKHGLHWVAGANLRGALVAGAELRNANLLRANLSGAYLLATDLRGAHLHGAHIDGADLRLANLSEANLSNADLSQANLSEANLSNANLSQANLSEANLGNANLTNANLTLALLGNANLSNADLSRASLMSIRSAMEFPPGFDITVVELGTGRSRADLKLDSAGELLPNLNANLSGANLRQANLSDANLSGANLSRAILEEATLVGTDLTGADLTGCRIYGASAWSLILDGTKQQNLIITRESEPAITVDQIEVAQFIYLMLNNQKVRDVLDTITSKVVLILGRFTGERKAVLEALREELRKRNYLPILFDFEVPERRNLTETITLLARMARFIIADLTDPRSIPQELQAIIPSVRVPVQPLLLEGSSIYSMFKDFDPQDFHWVLPVYQYKEPEQLLATLAEKVIAPAEGKVKALEERRRMIEAELSKPR